MRVEFDAAVLNCDAAFRHLTALVWMFVDGRHRWVVSDPDAVARSRWLAAQGESFRRETIAHAEKAARSLKPAQVRVLPMSAAKSLTAQRWDLAADVAESVLRQPVMIVVENARCDGAFLRFVLLRVGEITLRRRLGPDILDRLRRHWQNPLGDDEWFSIRHGGGSTTEQQLELLVEVEPTATRRLFALVDSDRAAPNGPLGQTAHGVEAMCNRLRAQHPGLRLEWWVLRKREVENYLPRDAIDAHSRRGAQLWDQLDAAGKDYSDLKQVCGNKLWRIMLEPHADHHFHAGALRERGGSELSNIIERLLGLL